MDNNEEGDDDGDDNFDYNDGEPMAGNAAGPGQDAFQLPQVMNRNRPQAVRLGPRPALPGAPPGPGALPGALPGPAALPAAPPAPPRPPVPAPGITVGVAQRRFTAAQGIKGNVTSPTTTSIFLSGLASIVGLDLTSFRYAGKDGPSGPS